jgi:transcriptional regulator with XRE-family HTH domain
MADPTVRRRRLGGELRKIREGKGLSLEDVEKAGLGINVAKLSRLENARTAAKREDVVRLLDFYDVDNGRRESLLTLVKDGAKRGWWVPYGDVLNPFTADLLSLEADAARIYSYEPSIIPGLMQTARYAREAITATRLRDVDALVEEQVTIRTARQSVLTKPEAPQVRMVIHEAGLSARVGDDGDLMKEQMQRLLDLSRLPNVDVQVMPAAAALHPGIVGGFTILGFAGRSDLDVVHTERLMNSLYIEDPAEVGLFGDAFQKITAEALPVDASLRFITEQRDRYGSE